MFEIITKLLNFFYLLKLFIYLFTEVEDFEKIITSLLSMLKELGDNVERQKMSAIGATNLLKSIAKDRESEQTKLQVSLILFIFVAYIMKIS